MKIVLNTIINEYLESISFKHSKKFDLIKNPLEVKFFVINESIGSDKLSIIKKHFQSINFNSLCIYST